MKNKTSYTNKNICSFKKWSRKSYAVFNSLKVVVKICVLCFFYTIIKAQPSESPVCDTINSVKTIDLEEVEVIGQRSPTVFHNIARIIEIIPDNNIKNSSARSIHELLDYYSGIDIRQRGYFGIQADINVRGGTFDQTQILLNGMNISDPQSGHSSLNLPVDLEYINRIEIVKGPSARVLGSNAFTGAIHIVTEDTDSNNINVSASKGSYNYTKLNTSLTWNIKNINNTLYASNSSCDGYMEFTGFKTYNLYYNGMAKIKNTTLKYHFGYDFKDYEANSYYSSRYPEQYENSKTFIAALKVSSGEKIKLFGNTSWKRLVDHYSMVIDSSYTFHAYNLIDVFGLNMNMHIPSIAGLSRIGIEQRTENIFSSNRGEDLDDPVQMPGYDSIYLDKGYIRSNIEYFIEHNVNYKNFHASAGFMINWNSSYKNKINVCPGIDISYQIMDPLKVFFTANKTQRLPTFTDMFYDAPDTYGNKNLKPETAFSMESGLKMNRSDINGHLSWFYRKGKNNIDWVYIDSVARWHAENVAEISVRGIEFSTVLNIHGIINRNIFLNRLYVSYTYIDLVKSTGNKESKYALDHIKRKFTFVSDYNFPFHFGANISLKFQDRMGKYDIYDSNTGTTVFKPYPTFILVDSKFYRNWKNFHLYVKINNMFDIRYRDIGNIIQPGRFFIAGIKYRLNL